ncbi:aspartate-semialdehyde dehydrogenase [bacterium]|nr:aspartate-semialdehyde dehydrogenase [bacterium]
MRLALVGATGLVGQKMIQVLEERKILPDEFLPVASSKSVGNEVDFGGKKHKVVAVEDAVKAGVDVAIFSAGGNTSLEWAPKFAETGAFVIDNSSAWRMHLECPLVVPEINADSITEHTKIIANPNCSTIQLVMVLKPLMDKYGLRRVVVSTYQSITGTGKAAIDQMSNERNGVEGKKVYPYHIDLNCLPHCDVFTDNLYTKEEMKLVNETRKILGDSKIGVTATAVRVPVMGGHSESVNVELKSPFNLDEVRHLLHHTPGVVVIDDPKREQYPMPLYQKDHDDVFVGRIRTDESQVNTLNMWIVADNLRKGAATNAVQILEYLLAAKLVH